jgi:hypothetical protein
VNIMLHSLVSSKFESIMSYIEVTSESTLNASMRYKSAILKSDGKTAILKPKHQGSKSKNLGFGDLTDTIFIVLIEASLCQKRRAVGECTIQYIEPFSPLKFPIIYPSVRPPFQVLQNYFSKIHILVIREI